MGKRNRIVCCAALLLCLGACGRQSAPADPAPESSPAAPDVETVTVMAAESPAPDPWAGTALVISEVMSDNSAALSDDQGRFPDWVEVQNLGAEPMDLSGWTLRAGKDLCPLPTLRLEPGELTFLSVDGGLSKEGERLELLRPDGTEQERLELPPLGEDESWQRQDDGSGLISAFSSPGYENGEEGYLLAQERLMNRSPLAIWEAMSYNEWYMPNFRWEGGDEIRSYHDWIELKNTGSEPVLLSDYYLSDKSSDRLRYRLPELLLGPGELYMVLCDAELDVGAPFGLNNSGEQIYLSLADGSLGDYMALHDVPYGMSQGRMPERAGFFYFAAPTPTEENTGGCRLRAQMPRAAEPDGVFEDVKEVRVSLEGPGEIRYTLDGSTPTDSSRLYKEPILLTETAVIRAACFQAEKLPSQTLDLSYLINEHNHFPSVSLVCDPMEFSGPGGIYTEPLEDREVQASVAFFPEEGGFHQICGLKIHGATSRITQDKKSFRLNFRDRFAGPVHYDLFGNGVTEFHSLLLRADQESSRSTYMRDNLMHRIAIESFPALTAQDGRWVILYLNGEYWGIYSLREAHSTWHYAAHNGLEEASVLHWKSDWPYVSTAADVYKLTIRNPMTDEELYQQAVSHLDTDSIIAWCLLQTYSGNIDFNPPNMRFYWTETDQKLHFALVDLDLTFFGQGNFGEVFGYVYKYNYLIDRLLQNQGFRAEFLRQAGEALSGPLSDEAVLSRIRDMAETLRPEIERDSRRWGETSRDWELMVAAMERFVGYGKGRAWLMARWLDESLHMTEQELATFFPWY